MSIQTSDMDHLTMVSDDGVGVAMHSLVRSQLVDLDFKRLEPGENLTTTDMVNKTQKEWMEFFICLDNPVMACSLVRTLDQTMNHWLSRNKDEWNVIHVLDIDNPLAMIKLQFWEDPNFYFGPELNHMIDLFMSESVTPQGTS